MEKATLVSLLVSMFVMLVSGCNKTLHTNERRMNPPDEVKAEFSDVVVFARVESVLNPDPVFGDNINGYGLILETICSYKGPQLPLNLKVAGAGEVEGCPNFEVTEGEEYIFFLSAREDDFYEMEYKPNSGYRDDIIDEISIICNLELKFPRGQNEAEHDESCVDVLPPGEICVKYKPTTTTPKPADTYTVAKHTDEKDVNPESEPDDKETEPEPSPEDPVVVTAKDTNSNGKAKPGASVSDNGGGDACAVVASYTVSLLAVIFATLVL